MTARFDWVVFDLNGTVLDPSAISAALPAPLDGEQDALDLLDDTVQQAMVDTLVGDYRPFPDYLRAATARRLRLAGFSEIETYLGAALTAAGQLPPFPEVARALDRLAAAGFQVATITNSPTRTAETTLEAAGLRDRFAVVVGSDVSRAYKPAPSVYQVGLDRIGIEAARACMVAAHGWDLHGAKTAGMATAWVSRKEHRILDTVRAPDFTGSDVDDVCLRILGLG